MELSRREWMALPALAAGQSRPRSLVIDAHNHLNHRSRRDWQEADRRVVEMADKLGIDQLCCSTLPPERPLTIEGCRESNLMTWDGMKRFERRVLGYAVVNPGYGQAALDEVRRAVEERGFIGIKLYNDYVVTEPVVAPLIELAIRLKVPILHHAGHTSWLPSPQPRISDAGHLAEVGRRYPEATLICAHVGGGGDWEWTIKALRNAPSVYLDTSGSVIDEGTVEMAVAVLGARRVLFACDLSMTASVGRIRGAALDEESRRLILGENMRRILSRRLA